MSKSNYTTDVGDYLVIWITGVVVEVYIAEVTQSNPLQMKVQESGPYAHLKDEDFIIQGADTEQFQKDCREDTSVFLQTKKKAGHKVISGLNSLGITDGDLHEMLPA